MTLPEFDFDKFMEEARDGILDYGHVVHYSDEPSAVYLNLPRAWTTGRTLWQRPELMIVGPFTKEQMQEMLNEAVDMDTRTPLQPAARIEIAGRAFTALEAEHGMFIIAMGMFGHLQGLQLVWADPKTGKFPGEPQPLFPPNAVPPQAGPLSEEEE